MGFFADYLTAIRTQYASGDATEHIGGLGNFYLALDGHVGVVLVRILQADFVVGS